LRSLFYLPTFFYLHRKGGHVSIESDHDRPHPSCP
jgi:hypothetical protein